MVEKLLLVMKCAVILFSHSRLHSWRTNPGPTVVPNLTIFSLAEAFELGISAKKIKPATGGHILALQILLLPSLSKIELSRNGPRNQYAHFCTRPPSRTKGYKVAYSFLLLFHYCHLSLS